MAHLRLLAIVMTFMLSANIMSCSRCYGSRKVDTPRLAGKIIDKRTGQPIEGMAVYQFYETYDRNAGPHQGTGSRDFRWVLTDAEGRFAFPAHTVAESLNNHVKIGSQPSIVLFERNYGGPLVNVPEDRSQWDSIVWEIEPDAQSLADLAAKSSRCSGPCSDLEGESYEHCYKLACGEELPPGRRLPERTR